MLGRVPPLRPFSSNVLPDREVLIAGRNSTETVKVLFPRNNAECSDFKKQEAAKEGGGGWGVH